MRKYIVIVALASFILACSNNNPGEHKDDHKSHDSSAIASKDTSKKSIPSETKASIGNTEIKINYHSPAVRGRTIWGGLVAYDAVWVTGAHKATSLEVGKDFQVGDQRIPAGKYAIFTVPGKDEWTVIINKKWDQHLADDYSENNDVVRIKVSPQKKEVLTERLKYEIDQTGEKTADIIISWEKLSISFGIKVL